MSEPSELHNRSERLLAALRYFCVEGDDLRPMQDGPKGMGWATIHNLEKAGLIEQAGVASGVRKTPFRTTAAGRAVLVADDPHLLLPGPNGSVSYAHRRSEAIAVEVTPAERGAEAAPNLDLPIGGAYSALSQKAKVDRGYAPRGLSRRDAAWYIGVSVTKFDEMVRDGRMPKPKHIDSRRVWDRHAVDSHFDDLPSDAPADADDWDVSL